MGDSAAELRNDKKYAGFARTQLERAQKAMESGSTALAEKSLENGERYLEKISDGYKTDGEGHELLALLSDLKGGMAGSKPAEKSRGTQSSSRESGNASATDKSDSKYAGFARTQLERAQTAYEDNSPTIVGKSLENAERYLDKISDAYKSGGEGSELLSLFDNLKRKYDEQTAAATKAKGHRDELREAENKFRSLSGMDSFIETYNLMLECKDGNFNHCKLDRLETYQKEFAALKAFIPTFKERFSLLLVEKPDFEARDVPYTTVSQMAEVFERADEYFSKVVQGTLYESFTREIEVLKTSLAHVKEKGVITYAIMSRIYPDDLKGYSEYQELKEAYEKCGMGFPAEMDSDFKSLINEIKSTLISASETNRWNEGEYPLCTPAMTKCFKELHTGQRREPKEILHIGSIPEDQWDLHRNDLGVIIYEGGQGYAVYSTDDLPFNVGIALKFFRPYGGGSKKEINDIAYSFNYRPFAK